MKNIIFSLLYLTLGSASLWIGITFINGTLFSNKLLEVYKLIPSEVIRMILMLPFFGIGHYCFSIAMKSYPTIAGPASILFTVIPPVLYTLFLLELGPNIKIILICIAMIFLIFLLSLELNKIS